MGQIGRYGFGMSRDAHIAFVTVYLTILLLAAGFGILRFALVLPYAQFHWPVWPSATAQRDHGPIADPALGPHQAVYSPIAVKLRQQGDVLRFSSRSFRTERRKCQDPQIERFPPAGRGRAG